MEKLEYVFCYGSNQTKQLSERLESDFEDLFRKSYSGLLRGYCRIYCNSSTKWNGQSVASIMECEDNAVEGYVVKLNQQQIERLDSFEVGYDRIRVQVQVWNNDNRMDEKVEQQECWVYKVKKVRGFKGVCQQYLEACCCTLFLYNYLKVSNGRHQIMEIKVELQVIRGDDMKEDQLFSKNVKWEQLQQQQQQEQKL